MRAGLGLAWAAAVLGLPRGAREAAGDPSVDGGRGSARAERWAGKPCRPACRGGRLAGGDVGACGGGLQLRDDFREPGSLEAAVGVRPPKAPGPVEEGSVRARTALPALMPRIGVTRALGPRPGRAGALVG